MKIHHSDFLRNRSFLVFPLLLLLILLAYANSFAVGFQFDDLLSIVHNRRIQTLDTFSELSYWANPNNRPLGYFSFALNYSAGGLNPAGYHWVNIVLHSLSSFMVFLLSALMLQLKASPALTDKRRLTIAFLASALFALHPVQTMAVTYIVQRLTVLSALFYISGVYTYLKGRISQQKKQNSRAWKWFLLTAAAFLLAMLSKQNAISFPLMLFMAEWLLILPSDKKTPLWQKISLLGGILLVTAMLLLGLVPSETDKISRIHYVFTQLAVLPEYIQLIIWPSALNIDHFVPVRESFWNAHVISGLVLFLFLAGLIVYWRKKQLNLIGVGLAWFFIALSVESSIIPISDVMFEHRLYLPLAGLIPAIIYGIDRLLKVKRSYLLIPVVLLVLIAAAWRTHERNNDWQDEYTLWKKSMQQYPDNPRAVNNVGLALKKKGNNSQALEYYNRALKLNPNMVEARFNWGIVLFDQGNYPEALSEFNKVIELAPGKLDAISFRALTYGHMNMIDESLSDFNRYIEIDDKSSLVLMQRGIVHEMAGNFMDAANDYTKAMQLDPSRTILLINRSRAYFMAGQISEAYQDILEAKAAGHATDPRYIEDLRLKLNIKPVINP